MGALILIRPLSIRDLAPGLRVSVIASDIIKRSMPHPTCVVSRKKKMLRTTNLNYLNLFRRNTQLLSHVMRYFPK